MMDAADWHGGRRWPEDVEFWVVQRRKVTTRWRRMRLSLIHI